MNLNAEQLKAVLHDDGPLLVLAGAGAGKTRVLTHRIARLIRDKNVDASNILAVTFTNRAAGEMRERVYKLTGVPPNKMNVSTFHSFCLRLLRSLAGRLGYRPAFIIFDEFDQATLIKACISELNIGEDIIKPLAAVSTIRRLKDNCVTPERYMNEVSDWRSRKFSEIYSLYQLRLMEQNAMDFGDLIMKALELLESDEAILDGLRGRFRYILVDEYQDTNHAQYRLIKALGSSHGNVMVVGDEDQSIYGWRGADIRNILEFKEDFPDALVIRLEQNYRSTPTILGAANSVIRNNSARLGKELWSRLPDGEKITIAELTRDIDEAGYVVDEIERRVARGLRWDEIAVFYRTNAQSRVFEECFRNRGIPYAIYGGVKFYERMEIKDTLAYLQLVQNPANDTVFMRIINRPARGAGQAALEAIKKAARATGAALFDAIDIAVSSGDICGTTAHKISRFADIIREARVKMNVLTLGELAFYLMKSSGYLDSYKKSGAEGASERAENIEELLRAMSDFQGVAKETLPEFLDQVALVSDADSVGCNLGRIQMLTVHLSKGLEFPVVFMVGMEEGLFPHSHSLEDQDDLEEERRLCYVGMTRAKEKLYMTYCTRRRLYGREHYNLSSRFLNEIDVEYVDSPGVAKAYFSSVPVDSFDQRPADECTTGIICAGARVRHPVFGNGLIQKVEGFGENQKALIRFDGSILKKIVLKYARLEIL